MAGFRSVPGLSQHSDLTATHGTDVQHTRMLHVPVCRAQMRYFLGKDVHVCASSGHAVFLDLNSGRYMTLHERAARSLGRHIADWPMPGDSPDAGSANSNDAHQLLSQLIRKGLLTTEPIALKTPSPTTIARPTATLLDCIDLHEPVIRPHHVTSFLLCAFRARAFLRCFGIKAVVARVRRSRAAVPTESRIDGDRMRDLTAIFNRLQPLALDARDGCLLHSFALLEFLAHYKLFVQWIFAVRAVPFTAHCWLQQDTLLLNDFPQHAGYLSPILVV